jgi:hypothetical protein
LNYFYNFLYRFGTDEVPYAWRNVTKNGWIKKCILVKTIKNFASNGMDLSGASSLGLSLGLLLKNRAKQTS